MKSRSIFANQLQTPWRYAVAMIATTCAVPVLAQTGLELPPPLPAAGQSPPPGLTPPVVPTPPIDPKAPTDPKARGVQTPAPRLDVPNRNLPGPGDVKPGDMKLNEENPSYQRPNAVGPDGVETGGGDADSLQANPGLIEIPDGVEEIAPGEEQDAATLPKFLSAADVTASVYRSFPEINQARQESQRAQGESVAAYGAYDTKLKAHSLSEPSGFYRNYRNGIGVARQTWWGGNVAAGYRIGRGVYQPWYLERETEKGGEFKLGWVQPLLQGRAIDPERIAVFRASLARRAADPILQEAILAATRDGVAMYWDWVAAGAVLEAQRELLTLAERRGEQYQVGVKAGKFAEIDLVLNEQLIAERRAKTIESERKFKVAGFKLSLYLRDEVGQSLVPPESWLPKEFPVIGPLPETNVEDEIAMALARRPEPQRMQIELQQLDLDRQLARNQMLPRFDFVIEGSQDVGRPGTSSDDKGEFVLVVGATGEVPIQRRKARGKLIETSAKIAKLSEKLRMQRDKISVELRSAWAGLDYLSDVVRQAELSLKAARDTLNRYRFAFERGKIDLIYLNLLETKANESQIKLTEAQRAWFVELARYQAAAGLDPLDQAGRLSVLPTPDGAELEDQDADTNSFELDWQRRIGPQP